MGRSVISYGGGFPFCFLLFFLCSCSSSSFGCLFLYSAICISLWCSSWHFVRLSWGWSPNQGLVPLPKHHPEWCPGQNGASHIIPMLDVSDGLFFLFFLALQRVEKNWQVDLRISKFRIENTVLYLDRKQLLKYLRNPGTPNRLSYLVA